VDGISSEHVARALGRLGGRTLGRNAHIRRSRGFRLQRVEIDALFVSLEDAGIGDSESHPCAEWSVAPARYGRAGRYNTAEPELPLGGNVKACCRASEKNGAANFLASRGYSPESNLDGPVVQEF
jgi:hypothetical protein